MDGAAARARWLLTLTVLAPGTLGSHLFSVPITCGETVWGDNTHASQLIGPPGPDDVYQLCLEVRDPPARWQPSA